MKKPYFLILISVFLLFACRSIQSETYDTVSEVIVRAPDLQNVQFVEGQVLPPYGVMATAETAALRLQISTSEDETQLRIADIQNAIASINDLANGNDLVALEEISINQVNGSYEREEISTANIQNIDSSTVNLKLSARLAQHEYSFLKIIDTFNEFLTAIELPETISVQVFSIQAELGDLETYRAEIIAQVYGELNAVKDEFSETVKFEITGLYDPLKMIRISDVEYFLYLEPVVTTLEF